MNISNPEKAFAEGLTRLVAQHPFLKLELDWQTGIAILSSLQLSLRHPANRGHTAQVVRRFCDEFIAQIEGVDPALAQLLRMGDDPQHDAHHERPKT